MKRNLVASVIAVAMIAATLTGCAGTTQVAETPAPEKEETVVAEPTPAPETTETVETPEVVEEPEEEVAAEPEREVKTWDYEGIKVLSYDPENEYVAKIRAAIPDCNAYQGAFVAKLGDDTWTFYFEPEDGDKAEYFNAGTPGEDVNISDDEINKYFEATDTMVANYTQDGDNNALPKIDLDGDGKVTMNEALIVGIFVDNGRSGMNLAGHHVFAPNGSDIITVWDGLAEAAEEATAE